MRLVRPLLAGLLTLLLCTVSLTPVGASGRTNLAGANLPKVGIEMDGRIMDFNGYLVESRTMVPLRAIFEALGAVIEWNGETYTVTATKGQRVVVLTVGQTDATIDGKPVTIPVPPVLIDSRTYVPLRFVAEAMDTVVDWNGTAYTAIIKSGSDCALPPFQVHEGSINPVGETWGRCGSPHIVKGTFSVEGESSPILSIQEGAVVRFAEGASIKVGWSEPGGLMVYGTEKAPVTFTADTSGPQPGFWEGIRFGTQALQNNSSIEYAKVEYAGTSEAGAILVDASEGKQVEVIMKNVTLENNRYAGIQLKGMARLKSGSANLTITNTAVGGSEGGFPIITGTYGSHNLPTGTYRPNLKSAIKIDGTDGDYEIATNTTWKNLGVPYAINDTLWVEGDAAPTLTIEPGVISLWAPGTALYVGTWAPGTLVAEAPGVTKADLDLGLKLANDSAMAKECADCAKNKAIVFGSWNSAPSAGAWRGIAFRGVGEKSKLIGSVVAWGGAPDDDYPGSVYAGTSEYKTVKLLLAKSMIAGSAENGLFLQDGATLQAGSTGNYFVKNVYPVRASLDSIGSLSAENDYTGNENDAVVAGTETHQVTASATWQKLNVPYRVEDTLWIEGPRSPKLTLSPGTTLMFTPGNRLVVGFEESGDLIAVGTKDQPITFTGTAQRPGLWEGLSFNAGIGESRLENVIVEYAINGVTITQEVGRFIENSTFRNNKEWGIYLDGEVTTSHLEGNTFTNNGEGDESETYE